MKTKIIAILTLSLLILIGGAYLFVQTKSDFILKKISEIVEEASGAPLSIEDLPSINIIPSPNLSIGKASWGTEDFSITFDSANVKFSIFELLSGNVSLSELQLENLKVIYNDNPLVEAVIEESKPSKENNANVEIEKQVSDTFAQLFKVVPKNILISNASIDYMDKTQHIVMQNINTDVNNFAINQNANVSINSHIDYTITNGAKSQNYKLNFDTNFNFLVMGNNLNFDLRKLKIQPEAGFNFSEELTATGSSDIFLAPFSLRSLSAEIQSPFMNVNIKQSGDINNKEGIFDIEALLFPLSIMKTFAPEQKFHNPEEIKEAKLTANISFKDHIISIHEVHAQMGGTAIKSVLTYNRQQDQVLGSIELANLNLSHFIEPSQTQSDASKNNSAQTPQTSTATHEAMSNDNKNKEQGIYLPEALQKTSFNIDIKANNIQYSTLIVDSIDSKLQGKNSLLSFSPLMIKTMQSTILAEIKADLTKKQNVTINADIPSIHLATWSKALFNNDALAGDATVKTKLNFPLQKPISNINGSGDIQLSSVHVKTRLLPIIASVLQTNKIKSSDFLFAKGHIPFTIKTSVAHLKNAYISAKDFNIHATGDIYLETQNVNLEAQVEVAKKVSIPVSIQGHVSDPKVKISAANPLKTLDNLLNLTIKNHSDAKSAKDLLNTLNNLFNK